MGTRGEERLKAITDAATEVVAERGYYGMTIQRSPIASASRRPGYSNTSRTRTGC